MWIRYDLMVNGVDGLGFTDLHAVVAGLHDMIHQVS